ncbi:MAG: phosphoribosyl-AMP cyclohydrolase [Halarchaeum sp.]
MSEFGVDLDFGEDGLVPAVAQSAGTGEVLMLAYANREAVERTAETGRAHYYSRSRDELWEKGATSGHTQTVEEVRVDCDGDSLLYVVEQAGGACHTGHRSCFYRTLDGENVGEKVFDPDAVYE